MYKKGFLILSSRNRLYNVASLNNLRQRVEAKNYRELIQEIIDLKEMSFDKFKNKKEKSKGKFKTAKNRNKC